LVSSSKTKPGQFSSVQFGRSVDALLSIRLNRQYRIGALLVHERTAYAINNVCRWTNAWLG